MRFFSPRPYLKEAGWFVLFLLVAGGCSVLMGQDGSWDLVNYHFYNPFAFLHGRFYHDIMPAGLHSFLNPLLDVPYYVWVTYLNRFPRLVAFLMGLPAGITAFFIYKISWFYLGKCYGRIAAWLAVGMGVTGAMFISQLGLTTNEDALAGVVLAAWYCFLRACEPGSCRWGRILGAAFLAGAAVGLKYTAAPWHF